MFGRGADVVAKDLAEVADIGKAYGLGRVGDGDAVHEHSQRGIQTDAGEAFVHRQAVQRLEAGLQPFFVQAHGLRQGRHAPWLAVLAFEQVARTH